MGYAIVSIIYPKYLVLKYFSLIKSVYVRSVRKNSIFNLNIIISIILVRMKNLFFKNSF